MHEAELFIKSLYDIKLAIAFISFLVLMAYRVRIHHKVLFGPGGQLNFVTVAEKNQVVKEERETQGKENKRMEEKLAVARQEECPLHGGCEETTAKIKLQQGLNMQKIILLEADLKEGKEIRDDMSKKLSTICLNVNTLLTNQDHFKDSLKELKQEIRGTNDQ